MGCTTGQSSSKNAALQKKIVILHFQEGLIRQIMRLDNQTIDQTMKYVKNHMNMRINNIAFSQNKSQTFTGTCSICIKRRQKPNFIFEKNCQNCGARLFNNPNCKRCHGSGQYETGTQYCSSPCETYQETGFIGNDYDNCPYTATRSTCPGHTRYSECKQCRRQINQIESEKSK